MPSSTVDSRAKGRHNNPAGYFLIYTHGTSFTDSGERLTFPSGGREIAQVRCNYSVSARLPKVSYNHPCIVWDIRVPENIMNLEQTPRSNILQRRALRKYLLRTFFVVAYLASFFILDSVSRIFETLPGVVAWYPPDGLSFALLLAFGIAFAPFVALAAWLSSVLVYHLPLTPLAILIWSLIVPATYYAASWVLRHRVRFDRRLRSMSDVLWLVGMSILTSFVLAVLAIGTGTLGGTIPAGQQAQALFQWWLGETIGLLVVMPVILIHVTPRIKRIIDGESSPNQNSGTSSKPNVVVVLQTLAILLILYWVFHADSLQVINSLYWISLPVIWIAFEHGTPGASLAILALNFGITLALPVIGFNASKLLELQLFMLVMTITALLFGVVRTEQIRAIAISKNSENRFRALIENSTDAITLLDADGHVIYDSPAAPGLLGYGPRELIGHSVFSLIHPEDLPRAQEIFKQILQKPRAKAQAVLRLRYKDNTWRWIEGTATNLLDQPHVEGIVLNYRDITNRKYAELELMESEARFRSLYENTTIGLYRTTPDGQILLANPALVQMLGYTSFDELASRNLEQAGYEPGYERSEFLQRIEDTGEVSGIESAWKRKDGTAIFVRESARAIRDAKGHIVHYEGTVEDISDRKKAEGKILRQIKHLTALSEIDQAIASSFGMEISLTTLLTHVTTQLDVDAACVLLFNPASNTLSYVSGRGFLAADFGRGKTLRLGEGYAGKAALERRIVHIADLPARNDNPALGHVLLSERFVEYYGLPLLVKGHIKGVLEIFHRSPLNTDEDWLDFLQTLAGQAAIAIDNATLFDDLQRSNAELNLAYDATIEGWSHALDLRDKETEGHTQRVTNMTVSLARSFGLSEADIVHVRRGALLHDIGKMGVPDHILLKPGTLTEEEWVAMKKHPTFAYEMLSPIRYLRSALDIPYCHHEKWDGSGYPRGLKGEEIPLAARIFAVVDVYDAVTSDRPYRAGWSREKALEHIRSLMGTHFDPQVVDRVLASGILESRGEESAHFFS